MSEPFAEARITIIADTKLFREQLLAEVSAATKAASELAVVPLRVTSAGGAAAVAELKQLAATQTDVAASAGVTTEAVAAETSAIGALGTAARAQSAALLSLVRSQEAVAASAGLRAETGAVRAAEVAAVPPQSVLILPDTTKFQATLQTEVTTSVAAVKAPPVVVLPDLRAFRARLQAEVIEITESVKAPPVIVPVTAVGAANNEQLIASLKQRGAVEFEAARAAQVDAGALQKAGAQANITAAENRALAGSQALVARSQGILGGLEAVAAARVGNLSKARGIAAETTKLQAAAEEALALALRSGNVQQVTLTAGLAKSAAALNADAEAAVRDAVAHAEAAGSVSAHARSQEQFGRAIRANAASMTGLRGAVLSSSNAFIFGTVASIALTKSIQGASDQIEELNKTTVVFGKSSKEVEDFAKTTASSLGIAETEALKAVGVFGNLFRTIHISAPVSAEMSVRLVQLAADLASFNNASPERTLEALRSGLVGQARPLRVFGIFLSAARVQEEALRVTGKKRASDITDAEKVQARFNIILRDSVLAQGDFARTADRTANQSRILKANIANLSDEIGRTLLPAVNRLIVDTNRLFIIFNKLSHLRIRIPDVPLPPGLKRILGEGEGGKGFSFGIDIKGNFVRALKDVVPGLGPLVQFEKGLANIPGVAEPAVAEIDKVTASVNKLFDAGRKKGGLEGISEILSGLDELIATLKASGPVGELFAEQLQALRDQINKTGDIPAHFNLRLALRWLNLQQEAQARLQEMKAFIEKIAKIAGGVTVDVPLKLQVQIDVAEAQGQDTLPLLQQQLRKRQAFLNKLLAAPQGTFKQALIDQAARNVTETKNAIKVITDEQASTAREAADKITTARENANQAFLDAFDPKEQKRQNAISAAQASGSIQQQINAERTFRQFLKREIDSIARRIRALHLQGSALEAARSAIRAAQQKRFELKQEIDGLLSDKKDAREAAAQAAREARQQHLESLLSIAETTPGIRDDRAALERLIRFDTKQISLLQGIRHKTQEQKAQLDAYKVDLAQRNQALRELKDEQDKGTDAAKAFAQAQFEFLQTQQGFAANLLGNLIPLGAAGGLVGNTSAGGVAPVPGTVTGAIDTVRKTPLQGTAVGDTVQKHAAISDARRLGPSKVGQDTELHLLREIRRLLHEIHRGNGHPEAAYRRHHNRTAVNDSGHFGAH